MQPVASGVPAGTPGHEDLNLDNLCDPAGTSGHEDLNLDNLCDPAGTSGHEDLNLDNLCDPAGTSGHEDLNLDNLCDPAGTPRIEDLNLDNLSHKEAFKMINQIKAQFRTVYDSKHVAQPNESSSPDSIPDLIPFVNKAGTSGHVNFTNLTGNIESNYSHLLKACDAKIRTPATIPVINL
eukprot:gene24985-10648_t